MAKGFIEDTTMTAIADAIRAKGVEGTFTPSQMATAIAGISGGSDIVWVPEEKSEDYYKCKLQTTSKGTGGAYGSNYFWFDVGTVIKNLGTISLALTPSNPSSSYGVRDVSIATSTTADTNNRQFNFQQQIYTRSSTNFSATFDCSVINNEDTFLVFIIGDSGAATDTLILTWQQPNPLKLANVLGSASYPVSYATEQALISGVVSKQGSLTFDYEGVKITLLTAEGGNF